MHDIRRLIERHWYGALAIGVLLYLAAAIIIVLAGESDRRIQDAAALGALVAAVVAVLGLRQAATSAKEALTEAKSASTAATEAMYYNFNEFVTKHIEDVGPLTPFPPIGAEDPQLAIRFYLLQKFNRWRFDIGNKQAEEGHRKYKERVFMGNINEFRESIVNRGYRREQADACVAVLKELYSKEPYFMKPCLLWDEYFDDYWNVDESGNET